MPSTSPLPASPILTALAALIAAGRALFTRLAAPAIPQNPAAADPARASAKIERALVWLAALAGVLAGESSYRLPPFPRFPGRYPPLTAKLRAEIGLPPLPPPTDADRAAARRHYMHKVFATVPTGRIATRLARRIGLTPDSEAWPHNLVAITDPPLVWARRQRLPPRPKPEPPQAFPMPVRLHPFASEEPPDTG